MRNGKFIRGHAYFIVVFDDKDLKVPLVQTLIYRDVEQNGGAVRYLFDELHVGEMPTGFFVDAKDADHMVVDEQGLLDKLRYCFAGGLPTRRK